MGRLWSAAFLIPLSDEKWQTVHNFSSWHQEKLSVFTISQCYLCIRVCNTTQKHGDAFLDLNLIACQTFPIHNIITPPGSLLERHFSPLETLTSTTCQIGPNRLVWQFLGKPIRWLGDSGAEGAIGAWKSLWIISANYNFKNQCALCIEDIESKRTTCGTRKC